MSIRKMPARRKAWAILAISAIAVFPSRRVAGDGMFRLQGHVPYARIHKAQYLGPMMAEETMKLALVLKPRDQAGLDDFLKRVNDPRDPLFHQFLTPAQFADRFGPS